MIEAAGTVEAWRDALELVPPGRHRRLLRRPAARAREVAVDPYRLHYEELTLRGAFHHTPRHGPRGARVPRERRLPVGAADHARGRLEGVAALFADPPRDYLKAAVRP